MKHLDVLTQYKRRESDSAVVRKNLWADKLKASWKDLVAEPGSREFGQLSLDSHQDPAFQTETQSGARGLCADATGPPPPPQLQSPAAPKSGKSVKTFIRNRYEPAKRCEELICAELIRMNKVTTDFAMGIADKDLSEELQKPLLLSYHSPFHAAIQAEERERHRRAQGPMGRCLYLCSLPVGVQLGTGAKEGHGGPGLQVWSRSLQDRAPQPRSEGWTFTGLDLLALVISSEDPDTSFIKSAFAEWSIVIGSK
ncbi:hypothetical protein E5288_WYG001986 [Bos mutus]|uniref:Uncharacterized protein n=1 Tax=Bos mutus TaxID=72004 RepID=A0A6B0RQI7_9CETA|nr:hypothetical protein [Bos mutus]